MKMKHISTSFILFYLIIASFGTIQAQQKSISRIDKMPNKPSPYKIFDWKSLAKSYDAKVFDLGAEGSYLPLTTISEEDGINYPSVHNIRIGTYVGQDSKIVGEAINILPALVSASLVGINKSNQNSINWVEKTIDFFNKKNGQNVYLNNYSSTTGNDWWYEIMPNVFFYQLYNLYPNGSSEFKDQFITVANRQLDVVYKLGGTQSPWAYPNMNYRAFNLETGKGLDSGVKEPETAGSIAWLLYSAYKKTGDKRYLIGSQLSIDFLENETSNPSYEIQLPYGILTAAKLNAVENANYDIDKFLNWAFSDGKNTLRGWGVIVGNWNGYDVSGLIGEAKDAGNDYAFLMNGFQHAAALAPVVKYEKRYAKAIGKWLLNLSNASRLFYPGELPEANQEATSLAWSKQYDSSKSIPYESMKEKQNGTAPYATGDALSGVWAPTNLSLYSGSSIGYLAALLENTNVEGVLQIDLNVTDFGSTNDLNTYLYYNPNTTDAQVSVVLPSGTYNIYDAITETTLAQNVSGNTQVTVPSDDVRLLVLYPASQSIKQNGKLLLTSDGKVLDYHYKWNFDPTLRIKSLYTAKTELQKGDEIQVNVLADNASDITYEWYVNNEKQDQTTDVFNWKAIDKEGISVIKSIVKSNGAVAVDSVKVNILSSSYVQPEIRDITLSSGNPYILNELVTVKAETNTTDTIQWNVSGGTLSLKETLEPKWTLPKEEGTYTLELIIKNKKGSASKSVDILVKDVNSQNTVTPVVYYPMDGNTKNIISDNLNAISEGAVLTIDPQGKENRAYRFNNNEQYIYTPNDNLLNFQDAMTLSFWINPADVGSGEQFVLSHGSWEERYKVSLTPDKKVRFTINTTDRIVDIDDNHILENNKYVHYTFVFTGYSVEIYRDGKLSSFTKLGGKINKSTKALTMGRRDQSTVDYTYQGAIDEVKLFNKALDINAIAKLPTEFEDPDLNNVDIKKLTIDGVEWDVNKQYTLDCGDTRNSVTVNVEPYSKAKVDVSSFKVDLSKASVQHVKFTITSMNNDTIKKEYTLKIEKPFQSSELISQKWNKILIVNNNSSANGGFNFTDYQWFKNGDLVDSKQYYAVGSYTDEVLDPTAIYSVTMTTDAGDQMRVCPFKVEPQQTVSVRVYPTQAKTGEKICIDANMSQDMLNQSVVGVYTIEGTLVKNISVKSAQTYFDLPNTGIYVLKYEAKNGYKNSFKLIVK